MVCNKLCYIHELLFSTLAARLSRVCVILSIFCLVIFRNAFMKILATCQLPLRVSFLTSQFKPLATSATQLIFMTKPTLHRTGIRNSLLLAPMPTASTAQILGNNEAIEPYTSNIYLRRVLSGEFQVSFDYLYCSPKTARVTAYRSFITNQN